ncbi:UvrB/UvrC motif-containing protein [uncultured Flavonifractor sp.]
MSNPFRAPTRQEPCGTMREASKRLEFEYAAVLRDRIIELRGQG